VLEVSLIEDEGRKGQRVLNTVYTRPAQLLCGEAPLAKFGQHAGNMKLNTQNEE
jgi:hypothetical protein